MKILIVTGKLAEKTVRKYAPNVDVHVVNIDVAAFITPADLEPLDLDQYDLVLVPGLTAGCKWRDLEKRKKTKIRLGPIHAFDLQFVLPYIDKFELSHEVPACKLIEKVRYDELIKQVNSLENDFKFKIRDVPIGGNSRIKVVAEIVNYENIDELLEKLDYYVESGADIVDISIPLEFEKSFIRKAIKKVIDSSEVPVSIDTFDKSAIKLGIDLGVDMIMSVGYENFDVMSLVEDQAIVLVDKDPVKLNKLVERAANFSDKLIADPVLEPPLHLAKSIERYIKFREINKNIPVLFGIGNVTELSDADSVGINAVLTFIAEEIGCNLLFTTEASPKTAGCIKELHQAVFLSKIAKVRETNPKDVGISLLVLKDKVKYETESFPEKFVIAKENKRFVRDPFGDFIIYLAGGKIVCKHDKLVIVGKRAKEILDTIIEYDLVSRLDHAAYLGRELKKAEIALVLGKNYVQDRELEFGIYSKIRSNSS